MRPTPTTTTPTPPAAPTPLPPTPRAMCSPGQRVRVTQQVPRQSGPLAITVEGTVVKFEQQKTGSWFAHAKDDKLWLDRLELLKDDGEQVVLNLDQYSHVEVLGGGGGGMSAGCRPNG